MKTEILSLLRERENYVSGQELCNHFGVSRTAVWKVMNQLKEEGYEIEAVKNKGYKLLNQPDILSVNEIAGRLNTKWAGRKLYCLEETGSTNTDAKRLLEEGAPDGTLVVADKQNSGKGRRGRSWSSPKGTSIYMSIGLKPSYNPDKASMVTLIMALAVAKGIREQAGLAAFIKWPNDVVVNKKKVCGILTEMNAEPDYIHSVVIGTGINVNEQEFPKEIRETATSLFLEKGEKLTRARLVACVMEYFEQDYEKFLECGNLSGFLEEYNGLLINRGKKVKVLDPKQEWEGTARGINEKGELLVEDEKGQLVEVYAGEVSVRGLYGYV
ncbi:MAG: biotin--[acetyl-CoA-carboxylase] ligase [Roseburia sp.]|nr:biotin--[acetyl-CoA-carboxylase] ligase [Roseburia sp.]MCM1277593.1 biotin--[acetyl-CoA-carboxylase] ligase [Robinsoniella sp.]